MWRITATETLLIMAIIFSVLPLIYLLVMNWLIIRFTGTVSPGFFVPMFLCWAISVVTFLGSLVRIVHEPPRLFTGILLGVFGIIAMVLLVSLL
jgi:hypothetical protein